MPREGLHWLILSQSLSEGEVRIGDAVSIIQQHLSYAQLGAIAHDAPYFLGYGKEHPFHSVSELLHSIHGEDTLEPLRVLGRKIPTLPADAKKPAVAFLLGMLSHCVVDWTFHPLIFYFTGDYYHPIEAERLCARTQHRRFEVYLDSYFVQKPSSIGQIITDCAEHLGSITTLLSHVAPGFPDAQSLWLRSMKDFALSQKILLSPISGRMIRCATVLGMKNLAPLDALARFGRTKAPQYFSEKFIFCHPVTGAEVTTSLDELRRSAVQNCQERYDAWCQFFLDTAPAPEEIGKSLAFGMANTGVEQAKYFAEQFEI